MIDVRDLTIGCYVYDGDRTKFPMYVQAIGEDYVYLNFEGNEGDVFETTPEELQGIPLTEELLEKMGFKESYAEGVKFHSLFFKANDKKHLHLSIRLDKQRADISEVTQKNFPNAEVRLCSHIVDMKFLHELQNFAFLTTKQQLKVNL